MDISSKEASSTYLRKESVYWYKIGSDRFDAVVVKDCNYIDEDRQVRDQFVYGVSDDDLKKKLLEKGNTLTRIQAVSIGKAHETTNQEVQECCLKNHL